MHYAFRDGVDGHNSRRMHPVAIEEVIKTTRWPFRVFQFLLAVTEVNCHNAIRYFQNEKMMEQLHFRDELSDELIHQYLKSRNNEGTVRSKRAVSEIIGHKLVSVPSFKKFKGATLVNSKTRYPTWKCCELNSRVRTHCICRPGIYVCKECFTQHVLDST